MKSPYLITCRYLLLAWLLGSLLACSPTPKKSIDEAISDAVQAQDSDSAELDTDSPEYYINLASEAEGEERTRHLIRAAELLIQRGDIALASDQLKNLEKDEFAASRQRQIQLLAARIALQNNNPIEAVALIPDAAGLTPLQQRQATQIRADARFQQGYYLEAAAMRTAIDADIEDEAEREANHRAIWLAYSSLPEIELQAAEAGDPVSQGWLELARLFREAQLRLGKLQQDILDWGLAWPDHPVSNNFIDSIIDQHLASRNDIDAVAVMLPMSGKLAPVADAIRSGLLTAHYQQVAAGAPLMLRFYDTASGEYDFASLFDKAVNEGARSIIGPIDKVAINKLAQQRELDVPVLTLNYAENAFTTTGNLYQFGLLPEDEAEQAAELAIRDGYRRAAVLVPESEWGTRLSDAFSRRFKRLGGEIVDVKAYEQGKDDYRRPIQSLFNIDSSNRRHRDLERLLDNKLKFEPHRRDDVDMIFLAATSRSARGIMPAFKFHRAGDLPVYATSHVYTGSIDRAADRDLNGLTFCDLPWTLTSDNPLRDSFNKDWPEHRNLTRLFAMGVDAYRLVRSLPYMQNSDYARFPGETGNLYLDEYGRIHRELVWAQFKNGKPRYRETITAPVLEIPDNKEVTANDKQPAGTSGGSSLL